MNHFGEHIKNLRLKRNLLQRQLAALLETDTAFISKLEKGDKRASREQVIKMAAFFNISQDDLLSLWLGEKVYDVLKNEVMAKKALKVAEKKINYDSVKK
ncbi:MAG: helix-turn-helix transcriptional regulator [Bacteroidales bacterium]|jgi:transcriptional regulator with XRE-family HTH domain|nr:helix-turn-helix domain-containing protein [Bacteroidales bacterium]